MKNGYNNSFNDRNTKTIPEFFQGERVNISRLELIDATTNAPKLISESELITLMEKNGIGTDATIAEHIKKIQERNYVVKKDEVFIPTTLGEALVAGYNAIGLRILSLPNLRVKMENEMNLISKEEKEKDEVVQECVNMYKNIFYEMKNKGTLLDKALGRYFEEGNSNLDSDDQVIPDFSICGFCKGKTSLVISRNGFKNLKCGNDCNDYFYMLPKTENLKVGTHICPICSFQILEIESSKGSMYSACPHCYSNHSPDIEDFMPCFKCTYNGCPLVKNVPLMKCSFCGSGMFLKQFKAPKHGWFIRFNSKFYLILACSSNCASPQWLPNDKLTNVEISKEKCECDSYLLKLHLTNGSVLEGCLKFCDPNFLDELERNNVAIQSRSRDDSKQGAYQSNYQPKTNYQSKSDY